MNLQIEAVFQNLLPVLKIYSARKNYRFLVFAVNFKTAWNWKILEDKTVVVIAIDYTLLIEKNWDVIYDGNFDARARVLFYTILLYKTI